MLIVPRGRGATIVTIGATPIPGEGTIIFRYRVAQGWSAQPAARAGDYQLVRQGG